MCKYLELRLRWAFSQNYSSTMSGRNQEQESGLKCPADEEGLCSESGVAGVGRGGR